MSPPLGRPWVVAGCGLAALAIAMGVGRFAFTPVLPMMQDQFGTSVAEGGWLASANYAGYLVGALSALRGNASQRVAIQFGLFAVALATLAMSFTGNFAAWMALRAAAGFASAWVLVAVSAWSLEQLAKAGRPALGGVVYAGVGVGIVFAGTVCLFLTNLQRFSTEAWLVLGLASAVSSVMLWPVTGAGAAAASAPSVASAPRDIPEFWRLVFCYGAFGLGYIIPATFLPAMAKQIVSDPLWFGWAWPVFGGAAVASTLLAGSLASYVSHRKLWAAGTLVMGIGVLVPLAVPGLSGIVAAALCVGGTFMVNTMAGFQEARRVAGIHARALIAAMTAAFATGQIVGPLLVSALFAGYGGFPTALVAAAAPLFLAAYALYANRAPAAVPATSR